MGSADVSVELKKAVAAYAYQVPCLDAQQFPYNLLVNGQYGGNQDLANVDAIS